MDLLGIDVNGLVLSWQAEVQGENAPRALLASVDAQKTVIAGEISFAVMPVRCFAAKDQTGIACHSDCGALGT